MHVLYLFSLYLSSWTYLINLISFSAKTCLYLWCTRRLFSLSPAVAYRRHALFKIGVHHGFIQWHNYILCVFVCLFAFLIFLRRRCSALTVDGYSPSVSRKFMTDAEMASRGLQSHLQIQLARPPSVLKHDGCIHWQIFQTMRNCCLMGENVTCTLI